MCKEIGVKAHPARFPAKLPEFFIRFLTDPGDVVLDIFAGSNTTGFVCETEKDNGWHLSNYLNICLLQFLDLCKMNQSMK